MCGALLTLGQAYVFPSVSTTFRGIWIFIWQLKRRAWNCDLATVLGKGLLIDRHLTFCQKDFMFNIQFEFWRPRWEDQLRWQWQP